MVLTTHAPHSYPVNATIDPYEDEYRELELHHRLILQVSYTVFTVLSLICLVVNLLIIFVIVKYRRLREEKSNVIVLNWAIVNTFFMVSSPITLWLGAYWLELHLRTTGTHCFAEQMELTLLFADTCFIVLLTIYWYLELYHPSTFAKLTRNLAFFVGVVYIICAFFAGLYVDACYNRRLISLAEVTLILFTLAYVLFAIIVNIIHVIRRRLADHRNVRNVPLILTNTFFLSIIPFVVVGFTIHNFIAIITVALLYICTPVYFFIVLYKFGNHYNIYFKHVLSCKCFTYTDDQLMERPIVFNKENNVAENIC